MQKYVTKLVRSTIFNRLMADETETRKIQWWNARFTVGGTHRSPSCIPLFRAFVQAGASAVEVQAFRELPPEGRLAAGGTRKGFTLLLLPSDAVVDEIPVFLPDESSDPLQLIVSLPNGAAPWNITLPHDYCCYLLVIHRKRKSLSLKKSEEVYPLFSQIRIEKKC